MSYQYLNMQSINLALNENVRDKKQHKWPGTMKMYSLGNSHDS